MKKKGENIEIRIHNLKKEYGDLRAVNDLSLDVYKGEILGFLGPNGAGKTTTINMVCGLSPPSAGEILFFNGAPEKYGNKANRLGICPQENVFWPKLTCREQLVFMAKMYDVNDKSARERADKLLEYMGLREKSNVLAKKLSGGMKRRLSISLALVHDPDILILDEPEAGLDPQSRLLIRDFIKSLAGKKTVIITTHNMDEADRLSDRVVIMDHGTILLVDTPENLKRTVGEGDLLEFVLEDLTTGDQTKVIDELSEIKCTVKFSSESVLLQSKDIVGKVSLATNIIKSHGFIIRKMTMRENTLEDVFIYLTGRKLRE